MRQGLVAVVYDISTPNLVRGADCFVTTQVQYADANSPSPTLAPAGDPYTFQTFVGSTAYFPGTNGPVVSVGVLESADLGTVRFPIPHTASTGLAAGDSQDFDQALEDDRGLTILLIGGLTIVSAPLASP